MKYIGSFLGLTTILILWLAKAGWSTKFYNFYAIFFNDVLRVIYDSSLGRLNFASVYLIFGFLVFWIAKKVYLLLISRQAVKSKFPSIINLCIKVLNFSGWIVFLFYFLWGFNYLRPSLRDTLSLESQAIDTSVVIKEYLAVTDIIIDKRQALSIDTQAINMSLDWSMMEDVIMNSQMTILSNWGNATKSKVRVRRLFPSGSLLSFSTAGIYNPFSLEGHIDPGLHTLQYPFTAAHEMAHGYGYTDEGECNFIGFLTCVLAEDEFVNYSGWLGYWRYLHFEVKGFNPTLSAAVYQLLAQGNKADLKAIYESSNRYPDLLPKLRNTMYDQYLKANGVKSGMRSYSEIVSLAIWYKQKHGDFRY